MYLPLKLVSLERDSPLNTAGYMGGTPQVLICLVTMLTGMTCAVEEALDFSRLGHSLDGFV